MTHSSGFSQRSLSSEHYWQLKLLAKCIGVQAYRGCVLKGAPVHKVQTNALLQDLQNNRFLCGVHHISIMVVLRWAACFWEAVNEAVPVPTSSHIPQALAKDMTLYEGRCGRDMITS
eukprot:1837721-Amphidinium_carterae.2